VATVFFEGVLLKDKIRITAYTRTIQPELGVRFDTYVNGIIVATNQDLEHVTGWLAIKLVKAGEMLNES